MSEIAGELNDSAFAVFVDSAGNILGIDRPSQMIEIRDLNA